jgi:type II secretion system protein I
VSRRPRPGGPAGFTLLEVLVALTILSIAVVAAIQGFAQGLRLLKLSGDHQRAVLLADQKAREVVVPEEGQESGVEGDYRWERTTSLVPAPELTPLTGDPYWRVWQIAVRVQWDARRQVEVATLRTLPRVVQLPAQQQQTTNPDGTPRTTTPQTTTPRQTPRSPRGQP